MAGRMSSDEFMPIFLEALGRIEYRENKEKLVRFLRKLGLTPQDEEYQELMREFRVSYREVEDT